MVESVDVSLQRLGVDHLDIMLCHDIEFVDMARIVEETLPALRAVQKQGKVRFVGVSGYPMKIFRYVLDRTDLDVILSYNHYTLQNTMLADLVPYLKSKGVGIMNAAPFSARLLTNSPLPPWHKATPEVRAICRKAAEHCAARGVDIAQLARPVLPGQPRHGDLHRRFGQPRERPQVGRVGRQADRLRSCWARCWRSCSRSTTGSTSKAARRITIHLPDLTVISFASPRFVEPVVPSESRMRERTR